MSGHYDGPAFPTVVAQTDYTQAHTLPGMTLSDYFAAHAMAGLLSRTTMGAMSPDLIEQYGRLAYDIADAMFKAREARA